MRSRLNPEIPNLTRIVSILRALHWTAWSAHWKVKENYGDHLLFERVYEKVEDGIDPLVERLIGTGTTFNEVEVGAKSQELLQAPAINTAKGWCERLLALEAQLQIAVQKSLDHDPISPAIRNFLEQLLDDHATLIYLLQQRANMTIAQPAALPNGLTLPKRKFGRGYTMAATREALPKLQRALRRRDRKQFGQIWLQTTGRAMADTTFDSLVAGSITLGALLGAGLVGTGAGAAGGAAAGPAGAAAGSVAGSIVGGAKGAYEAYRAVEPALANGLDPREMARKAWAAHRIAQARVGEAVLSAAGRPLAGARALLSKKGKRALQNAKGSSPGFWYNVQSPEPERPLLAAERHLPYLEPPTRGWMSSEAAAEAKASRSRRGNRRIVDIVYKNPESEPKFWTEAEIQANIQADDRWAQRALCALYRQQTLSERAKKVTHDRNARGFSAAHARVGSILGIWMTMGHSDGKMRRELTGVMTYGGEPLPRTEIARRIALHYVKQLTDLANSG